MRITLEGAEAGSARTESLVENGEERSNRVFPRVSVVGPKVFSD